ncbi:MAG: hypothetical protein ACK4NB_02625, partial [Fimbriimonadales bacterium]
LRQNETELTELRAQMQSLIDGKAELAASLAAQSAEIERLTHEPIPATELDDTKTYLIGRHMIARVTLGGVTDLYKQAILYGLPLDYWRRYPEMLSELTAQEAQAAAARYLQPERFATVIVGERTAVQEIQP